MCKSHQNPVFFMPSEAFQIEDIQICYSCQPLPAQTWQLYVQNLAFSCLANVISNRRYSNIFEGSLEVKLPTIWTDEKRAGKRQREEKD